MNILDAIQIINEAKTNKFKIKLQDNKTIQKRLFVYGSHIICEYKPKSIKTGYPLLNSEIDTWQNICQIKPIDTNIKVKNFMQNVVKYLTISGLWENINNDYQKILSQGDDFLETVLSLKWQEQRTYLSKTINAGFHVDDIVTSARKGIISINYSKYERNALRTQINEVIGKDCDYTYSWHNKYDCNVTYKCCSDNIKRGWYSEEFKDCLNGHYYLALDERRAIFCEDD